jgi:hypothetical protein
MQGISTLLKTLESVGCVYFYDKLSNEPHVVIDKQSGKQWAREKFSRPLIQKIIKAKRMMRDDELNFAMMRDTAD